MYYILLKETAKRFLDKLDSNTREQITKSFVSLQTDPMRKGKILGGIYSGATFFEKRLFFGRGYRVYYTVNFERVVILRIDYEGSVAIHRIGDKRTQKKDIKKLIGLAKADKKARIEVAKLGGKAKKTGIKKLKK